MDLLDYGMKNEQSPNCVKRFLAKTVLFVVRKNADRYEKMLDKKGICVPEPEGEFEALMQKIKEKENGGS